jgi:hypothetical protein
MAVNGGSTHRKTSNQRSAIRTHHASFGGEERSINKASKSVTMIADFLITDY